MGRVKSATPTVHGLQLVFRNCEQAEHWQGRLSEEGIRTFRRRGTRSLVLTHSVELERLVSVLQGQCETQTPGV